MIGFTKGFDYEIELSGKSENILMSGQSTYAQDAGKKVSRFGKEWTGVTYKGFLKLNDEKIDVNGIDLYDTKTNLKIYSIDVKLINQNNSYDKECVNYSGRGLCN